MIMMSIMKDDVISNENKNGVHHEEYKEKWKNREEINHNSLSSCADEDFQCVDGSCLPASQQCNGHADCTDNSDEENCMATNALTSNALVPYSSWYCFCLIYFLVSRYIIILK
ncbi:Predicted protein [Gryllus bimaculatus]|nr:Predicted protein [Gryllus bimaculatus]